MEVKPHISKLIGREQVEPGLEDKLDYVQGKVILITGAGGSIGSEIARQMAENDPKQLVLIDIYENNIYELQQELKRHHPKLNLAVLIGSIRDEKRMENIFAAYQPEIVYHAAAHKHVPLMEDNPGEAIKNNVFGTYHVVKAANRWKAEKFILISTDKAVNPTNIMGASKRICEMLIQIFNQRSATEYVAVRFGNVLGSNGSVVPLFSHQIEEGGPITVTHPEVIRYFMTIPEAVHLVLQAGKYGKGGEISVLDMGEPVKILDLAKKMLQLAGYNEKEIEITFTGLRPGEKMFEELMMQEETMQSTPNRKIFVGKPIEVDEKRFFETLDELQEVLDGEPEELIRVVKKIVPTYRTK